MGDDKLSDAFELSGKPKNVAVRFLDAAKRHGIAWGTLLVLALQLVLLDRQTTLIGNQVKIEETQQQLNFRPVVSLEPTDPKEKYAGGSGPWVIRNSGRYGIQNISGRVLHFKKFIDHGWQVNISSEMPIVSDLKASGVYPIDLVSWTGASTQMDISGLTPVPFADFFVAAIEFARGIDNKRYLYLAPLMLYPNESKPRLLRPMITSMSGPLEKACGPDTIAIELTFEYFKRNPLPTPTELYNYQYVVGQPESLCLREGPSSLRK